MPTDTDSSQRGGEPNTQDEQQNIQPMRVAFVHPDLGIGGAERLVVDAAVSLKDLGHHVTIYTMHHDPAHSFKETNDGTLEIRVAGNTIIPRSIFGGRFHILCTILRSFHLSLSLLASQEKYDSIFIDQLSAPIPLLKLSSAHIFFYCHFPDLLQARHDSLLTRLYRWPFDWIEEMTTKEADSIAVNSHFTQPVFSATFKRITTIPKVLYPSLNLSTHDKPVDEGDPLLRELKKFTKDSDIVVSINRFERKKDLAMAIKAFDYYLDNIREMQKTSSSKNISVVPVKLIMAGGYDPRVIENVKHLQELVGLSKKLGLKVHTVWSPSHKQTGTNDNQDDIENSQVLFLPSFTENQRNYLFSKSKCVLYTPTNEHLGIVPLEAMYNKVPVIAIASGGPKETVIDGETGYLVPIPVSKNNTKTSNNDDDDGNGFIESISPEDKVLMIKDMAKYIGKVLENSKVAGEMGRKGRDRVERLFNYNAFGKNVERMLIDMLKHDGKPSIILPLLVGICVMTLAFIILVADSLIFG